ncbi:MAG: MarR family transcriptional regulator [Bacillota bacterium]
MTVKRVQQLMTSVAAAIQATEADEARCCGLTRSQCRMLCEVARRGELSSLTDLSGGLGLDLSTVSRVVDGLVREGLMVRRPDREDRRKIRLSLTAAGRELVDSYEYGLSSHVGAIWEQIAPSDREIVLRSLSIIATAQQKCREGCCNE